MSDDEITREVDPNWLTRLRRDAADDEHTIANADLLDQVRAAVREARAEPSPPSRPSAPAVSTAAGPTPADDASAPPAGQMSFPPPDPSSPVHQAKAAPTLTFPQARWQPPPRLKPVSAAPQPVLLSNPPTRSGAGGRRVLIVGIIAAVAALTVGVIIGRSGSSDPKPGDDTSVSTPGTGPGNTTTGDTTTGNTTTGSTTAGTGEVGS
jgi:hypothetical protein